MNGLNVFTNRTGYDSDGIWGVYALSLSCPTPTILFSHNKCDIFPAASLVKICILIELYRQSIEEGLCLSTPFTILEEFRTTGSGILQGLSDRVSMTLSDLAILMMQFSDNTAANALIATLSREKINQTMIELGLEHTTLQCDRIDVIAVVDDPHKLATTTPQEMATLFMHLTQEEILTPRVCREILTIMKRGGNKRRISGQLPFRSDITVFHKTGTLKGVCNDAGLVRFSGGQYIISALSKNVAVSEDPRYPSQAEQVIARLSRWVFDKLDQ